MDFLSALRRQAVQTTDPHRRWVLKELIATEEALRSGGGGSEGELRRRIIRLMKDLRAHECGSAKWHAEAGTAALLKAVFGLFREWKLGDAQARVLLGEPERSDFRRWKCGKAASVPDEVIERATDLLGVRDALRYVFVDPERRSAWLSRPNEAFGGQSVLERMARGGREIAAVRRYLEAELGGW